MVVGRLAEVRFIDVNTGIILSTHNVPYGSKSHMLRTVILLKEYYRLDEHAEIREAYLAHIEAMLSLAGIPDAADQARRIFDLETRIAACHWDKVRTRDMVQMYFPQTWEEFTALSPDLAWDDFLAGAELPEAAVSRGYQLPAHLPA